MFYPSGHYHVCGDCKSARAHGSSWERSDRLSIGRSQTPQARARTLCGPTTHASALTLLPAHPSPYSHSHSLPYPSTHMRQRRNSISPPFRSYIAIANCLSPHLLISSPIIISLGYIASVSAISISPPFRGYIAIANRISPLPRHLTRSLIT